MSIFSVPTLGSDGEITIEVDRDGTLRIPGMLTKEEMRAADRVRNSLYYLVRNDGPETGGPAPCRHGKSEFDQGHVHQYFTYMCVERPWRGLDRALRYWTTAARFESDRRSQILAGMGNGLVDYAEANPESGKMYTPATPNTMAWYSAVAGVVVPLEGGAVEAQRYIDKINGRRPPVRLTLNNL